MGFGDAIMASALVRNFHAQGKLAAFGDGQMIKWTGYCEDVFAHNPNIARPGQEAKPNIVWLPHYKKNLTYCRYDGVKGKYIWNYQFKADPGELYFAADELVLPSIDKPFIVIEPNVAWQRRSTVNKDWGEGKYEKLAQALMEHGHVIIQCIHGNSRRKIDGAQHLPTTSFRQAIRIMSKASLIIAPEGGNHHAAAAIDIPAVILWGDWSPVQTMGYATQVNLTGGMSEACGATFPCRHCRAAFDRISVDEVYHAAIQELN